MADLKKPPAKPVARSGLIVEAESGEYVEVAEPAPKKNGETARLESCGSCHAGRFLDSSSPKGNCCLKPPVTIMVPVGVDNLSRPQIWTQSAFPVVSRDDFCIADYKPRKAGKA